MPIAFGMPNMAMLSMNRSGQEENEEIEMTASIRGNSPAAIMTVPRPGGCQGRSVIVEYIVRHILFLGTHFSRPPDTPHRYTFLRWAILTIMVNPGDGGDPGQVFQCAQKFYEDLWGGISARSFSTDFLKNTL